MAPKASSLLFLALFLVFSSTSTAFNITRLLGQYPEYGAFNDLLSQTKLAAEINSRLTITVLAVVNSSIGSLSGKPLDEVKRILSNHIILDYYDILKIKKLNKKSTVLTTLYQTTGVAENQQGFLNVTISNGDVLFGSAVKQAVLNSKLLGSVASQPYNISVLEVSEPIVAPGIEYGRFAPPPPPPAPKAASPPKKAPAPSEEEDDTPEEAPTEAPTESSPVASPPAPTPTADTPADSPPVDKAADAAPAPKSGSSRMTVGSGVGVAVVMGLVLNFAGF